MIQPALYSSVQYSQSFESHLCKAESWEKIDQPRPFYQNPPCTNLRSGKRLRDKFRSEYLDLKERCLARYDICKGKGCQCSTIYHNHFFWSKGVVLSLIMNVLFSTAMHGANAKLLRLIFGSDYELLHMVIIIYAALQILFPLAGYIADTHISRYAVIQFSLWSAWISFAALGLVISLDTYDGFHSINRYFVMPMIFIFILCMFHGECYPFGIRPAARSFTYSLQLLFLLVVLDIQLGKDHCHNSSVLLREDRNRYINSSRNQFVVHNSCSNPRCTFKALVGN